MRIPIGTIANLHGIKGALKIKTDSDFKALRYQKGNVLYVEKQHTFIPLTVEGYFEKKGFDVVSFKELLDANEALKYKGCTLYINESDREALEEDEFYYDELIGKKVVFKDEIMGEVIDVKEFPQSAMLVIKTKEKRVLVPFLKHFVKEVDEMIVLNEVEGLL